MRLPLIGSVHIMPCVIHCCMRRRIHRQAIKRDRVMGVCHAEATQRNTEQNSNQTCLNDEPFHKTHDLLIANFPTCTKCQLTTCGTIAYTLL